MAARPMIGRACCGGVVLLTAIAASATAAIAQPPPVSPQDFVNAAGGSDQYEIMAANTALGQSREPAVRAFAQEMIRDHGAMTSALRDAAMRSGLEPPSGSVGADQTMLLASLQGLRGADFDRSYARQQVLAHRSALATQRGYARDGTDAKLRAVATANTPMIEHHLEEATALLRGEEERQPPRP